MDGLKKYFTMHSFRVAIWLDMVSWSAQGTHVGMGSRRMIRLLAKFKRKDFSMHEEETCLQ